MNLDENDQAETTWEGKLCGIREDEEHKIILYKVYGFYVEVYYHKEKNKIITLIPFRAKSLLEPYFNLNKN